MVNTAQRIALTPDEVAMALGVTLPTIYALIRTGELPSSTIGASRRIPVEAVQALLTPGRASRTR